MEKRVRFVELRENELVGIIGGDLPGRTFDNHYEWERYGKLTLPIHGSCPLGTTNLGYIGGGNFLCTGEPRSFFN